MAEDWVMIVKKRNISIDVFVDACILHREGSDYFPTIKNILDRCRDVWAERQRNIKKLPELIPDLTPAQIRENAARARAIVKKMSKAI